MARRAENARDLALDVLWRVSTQGAFASAALRAALDASQDLDPRDKALATEIVYGVLRRRLQLDRALADKKRFKAIDPKLHNPLRIAAYQLLFLDRVPAHAAVNAAVDQARARMGEQGARLTNAVLRSFVDMGCPPAKLADFEIDPVSHVSIVGSVPHAVASVLVADLGAEAARDLLLACLEPAPLVLRANLLRTTREALVEEVKGTPGHHPRAVHLADAGGLLPASLPAVLDGRATNQDEASMSVIDMLDPQPGETVFDLCAAPGGKTSYIAERMEDRGKVMAYDRTPEKLAQIGRAAKRLGLASIEVADTLPDMDFDRVIVDAPCSGLGTLRRHPELRWNVSMDELPNVAKTQKKLLASGASRVKVGGVLVYSVCTVPRMECEEVVRTLDGFELEREIRTTPRDPGSPDAFYAARLVRRR